MIQKVIQTNAHPRKWRGPSRFPGLPPPSVTRFLARWTRPWSSEWGPGIQRGPCPLQEAREVILSPKEHDSLFAFPPSHPLTGVERIKVHWCSLESTLPPTLRNYHWSLWGVVPRHTLLFEQAIQILLPSPPRNSAGLDFLSLLEPKQHMETARMQKQMWESGCLPWGQKLDWQKRNTLPYFSFFFFSVLEQTT